MHLTLDRINEVLSEEFGYRFVPFLPSPYDLTATAKVEGRDGILRPCQINKYDLMSAPNGDVFQHVRRIVIEHMKLGDPLPDEWI